MIKTTTSLTCRLSLFTLCSSLVSFLQLELNIQRDVNAVIIQP